MSLLTHPYVARLHQKLFATAYRLHEAELDLVRALPGVVQRIDPAWPDTCAIGVDIGAGLGPYALAMLGCCRHVIAIEPNREQADYLRRAFGDRVAVVEAAASDRAGEAMLADASESGWRRPLARLAESGATAGWRQPCVMDTVDALVGGRWGLDTPGAVLVKLDVEGHERAVLRGMGTLLGTRRALLIVEIEARLNPNARAVFDDLALAGFACYAYDRGQLVPASFEAAEAMAGRTPGRFARLTGYRSNFVFLR